MRVTYYKQLIVSSQKYERSSSGTSDISLRDRLRVKSTEAVACKKGVLKNFTRFTGKYLCQVRSFPVNFAKFLRTPRVAASESNTNCCQYELYTMKLLKYKTCKNSVCKEFNSNPTPFHFVCVIKTCFLTNKFNII